MLSHFFKKEVIFSFKSDHDWTTINFFTPLPKWKEDLKNVIGIICSEGLYFDDYLFGNSMAELQEVNIHADVSDIFIDYLVNRHGFTQSHSDSVQDLSKGFNSDTVYFKKLTEKQFYAFLKDFEKLQIVPEISNIFEHIKSFDDF